MNAFHAPVEIKNFVAYSDASGANALGSCAGYVFAVNWIGDLPKLVNVASPSGRCARREPAVASERVAREFMYLLCRETSRDWRAACARMYAA